MLKLLLWIIGILFLLYAGISLFFYLFQERLIFYPSKLSSDVAFSYTSEFEEYFIEVEEGVKLHGLLFRAASGPVKPRGELVFYLHGNAGALDTWGYAADVFLEEGYDVFILDYRGYGKSEGEISSKAQFYADVEKVFQEMLQEYEQEKIIITGFSIGSGPAAWLASQHQPKMLILQAPYYSLKDLANHHFAFLPARLLLRYNFQTWKYLQQTAAPVVILHGTNDEVIPYESSLKLQKHFKEGDQLYALQGLGHNNMSTSQAYRKVMKAILP